MTAIGALVVLTAAALALRVAFGRGIGYPTDMVQFVHWADAGARHPAGEVYSWTGANYPPLYVLTLRLLGEARAAFPVLARPDLRYLVIKLPPIATDLAIGWLVYVLVARELGRRRALWAASLYLFNPAVISDSAVWGQTDGVVALFPLVALLALDRGAWWLVGPCLAAALATKFQSVTLVATLVAFVVADVGVVRALATVAIGALAYLAIALPVVLTPGQLGRMLHAAYAGNLNAMPFLRLGAVNFWELLDPAITDDDVVLVVVHGVAITPKLLGLALFALAWLPATLAGCATRNRLGRAYALGMVAWIFFTFPTEIHERYLLPAVAFFSVTAPRGRAPTAVLAVVTALHLYSCFFRYSWGADAIVPMMTIVLVPTFLAAMYRLRVECLAGRHVRGEDGALVALSRWTTKRIAWPIAALVASSACVALAVGGWFHAAAGEVSLARLGPYAPGGPATPADHPSDAIRARAGEPVRFRFPPVFGALRSGIATLVPTPDGCAATFTVRAPSAEVYASEPLAGDASRTIVVPVAPGDTDLRLVVRATGCPPDARFEWRDPRLVAWRPAEGWTDDALAVSDAEETSGRLAAVLRGRGVWRRDRSVQGNPLSVGGVRYAKGIGVQVDSVLRFAVPDGAVAFVTDAGWDDEVTGRAGAKIAFSVLADGEEAYRSPDVTPGERLSDVRIPLAGKRAIRLVAESPSPTVWDHADWANARFVRR